MSCCSHSSSSSCSGTPIVTDGLPLLLFFTFSVIGSRESRVTIPSFGHLSLLKRDLAAGRAGLGPEWRFGQVSQIAVEKRNMFCYIFGKCPRGPTGSQGFPGVPEGSKKTNEIVVPYQLAFFLYIVT